MVQVRNLAPLSSTLHLAEADAIGSAFKTHPSTLLPTLSA